MDAATLQTRIYAGYGKAALRIGPLYSQYRPTGSANPLSTVMATLNASFNADDMTYSRPNTYGKSTWYGVFDGRITQPGDYLVGQGGTFFIAAQQLTLPILCVECNRRVCVLRMPLNSNVGAVNYGGDCSSDAYAALGEIDINGAFVVGWPASISLNGRAETTGTNLPAGMKNAGWRVLLPPSLPITLYAGDILLDDLGQRYSILAAEQTDLGWRIQANEGHA